jgi:meso-butanediol dehydrogenase/(S,S)-butanediol dehydrogenase/diacetyl reductase
MVDDAVARFGRLDVLHNNAGYGLPGTVAGTSDETFAEMLRVNLCGVLYGTRAALRHMTERQSGVIVNTASNAGLGAPRDRAAYGSAKAGVIALTRSTAVENGRFGIRAVAICPGPIETPAFLSFAPDADYYRAQIPIRRLGRPEDVAELARFLASDRAGFLTGVAISLDGGLSAKLSAPFLTPDEILDR